MNTQEIRQNAADFYQFSVAAAFDQHRRHPEFTRAECLQKRTSLQRLLGGATLPVYAAACRKIEQAETPEEMMTLLPEVQDAVLAQWRPPDANPEFPDRHCVRWAVLPEKNWCYLHFHNSIAPKSFLAEPGVLKQELLRVIAEAEKDFDTVFTASWLNSHPAFLRYFPPEWRQNACDPGAGDVAPTNGWQGQFITRTGGLNRKTADYYLANGVLQFPRLAAFCPMAALKKWLNA